MSSRSRDSSFAADLRTQIVEQRDAHAAVVDRFQTIIDTLKKEIEALVEDNRALKDKVRQPPLSA